MMLSDEKLMEFATEFFEQVKDWKGRIEYTSDNYGLVEFARAIEAAVLDARGEQDRTVTVRYDLSSAEIEGAIRGKLIELGRMPPGYVAQWKQEPVVEFVEDESAAGGAKFKLLKPLKVATKLYAAPIVQQQQEPASNVNHNLRNSIEWEEDYAELPNVTKLYAAPIEQHDYRAIANQIVSNLKGRKQVIDLDLEEELVEEIMQEMEDTIRAMITTAENVK